MRAPIGLALLLVAGAASAQTPAAGRIAYLEARFDASVEIFEAVVAAPASSRSDLALAHRYLAALRAAYGNADAAADHVRIAAFLEPGASLPEGAPPELQALMNDEPSQEAEVSILVNTRADKEIQVVARAPRAPIGAVARVELVCGDRTATEATSEGAVAEAMLDEVSPGRCSAHLLAPSGAVVARAAQQIQAVQLSSQAPEREREAWRWVVGIGAAVAVAGVVIAVVVARSAQESIGFEPPVIADW